jgi:hypothetical protein
MVRTSNVALGRGFVALDKGQRNGPVAHQPSKHSRLAGGSGRWRRAQCRAAISSGQLRPAFGPPRASARIRPKTSNARNARIGNERDRPGRVHRCARGTSGRSTTSINAGACGLRRTSGFAHQASRVPSSGRQGSGGCRGPAGSTSASNLEQEDDDLDLRDQPRAARLRRVRPRGLQPRPLPATTPCQETEKPGFPGLSMKRTTGLEPATFGLGSRRSTD